MFCSFFCRPGSPIETDDALDAPFRACDNFLFSAVKRRLLQEVQWDNIDMYSLGEGEAGASRPDVASFLFGDAGDDVS